jgi:multiple sugar transport system substrate-binding protein
MKMQRRGHRAGWGITVALVAVAALLAACGQGGTTASSSGPVTITFLSYSYGEKNAIGAGTKKLIDDFEAANPNIKVQPQAVATADVLTKLQTSVVGGTPPDVAQIGWSKVAQAAQTLPLRAFQDIASADDWQSTIAGIVPSVLKASTPVSSQQKISTMPFMMATPVLFINANLFRAAGLDPTHPPTTMTEVKQAALAIKAKTGADGTYVSAVDPGKSDYLTQSLVDSAGGSLLASDGSAAVDSQPAIDALSAMQDLTKSGAQPAVKFDSALSAFSAGKLGMLVTTGGGLPTLDQASKGKFPLQVAPFPGFDGHPVHPTFSGNGLAILAKDSAKAQAAWKFVQFMTNEKSFEYIASKLGYLPLRSAAAPAADPRMGPALAQLADLAPYTTFPGKHSNEGVVVLQDEAVEPIVLRGADPATTLHAAEAKIKSLG